MNHFFPGAFKFNKAFIAQNFSITMQILSLTYFFFTNVANLTNMRKLPHC